MNLAPSSFGSQRGVSTPLGTKMNAMRRGRPALDRIDHGHERDPDPRRPRRHRRGQETVERPNGRNCGLSGDPWLIGDEMDDVNRTQGYYPIRRFSKIHMAYVDEHGVAHNMIRGSQFVSQPDEWGPRVRFGDPSRWQQKPKNRIVRMGVSMPLDVRIKMQPYDSNVNWSQVAAEAFEMAVGALQKDAAPQRWFKP